MRLEYEKYKQWVTKDPPLMDEKLDSGAALYQWWYSNRNNFKILFSVAAPLFTISVSGGAEVERSFKTLRKTLPKDHSRDSMNPDLIEAEVFFSFNRDLIKLFQ